MNELFNFNVRIFSTLCLSLGPKTIKIIFDKKWFDILICVELEAVTDRQMDLRTKRTISKYVGNIRYKPCDHQNLSSDSVHHVMYMCAQKYL